MSNGGGPGAPSKLAMETVSLGNGKAYKVQKIRQRRIFSCIPCHQRKIKCSREKPICSSCMKLFSNSSNQSGEASEYCKYYVNDKKTNLLKDTPELEFLSNGTVPNSYLTAPQNHQSQSLPKLDYPHNTAIISKLLEGLPASKNRFFELLQIYQYCIHPLCPVVNMSEFMDKAQFFWKYDLKDPEKAIQVINSSTSSDLELLAGPQLLSFVQLLYAVFACSSLAESAFNIYHNLSSETKIYYKACTDVRNHLESRCRHYDLETFQSVVLILILGLRWNVVPLVEEVGKTIRAAQLYRLNRDPMLYHKLKNEDSIMLRRTLWWLIFSLDGRVSHVLGLPPILRLDDFDTSMSIFPNDIYRRSICTAEFRYSCILSVISRYMNGMSESLPQNTVNFLTRKLCDLSAMCVHSIKELATELECNSQSNNISSLLHYGITLLSILPDRAFFHLYNSALHSSDTSDPNQFNMHLLKSDVHQTASDFYCMKYSYTDLSNALLPSLIHYIAGFISLYDSSWIQKPLGQNCVLREFSHLNWHLYSYVPMNELIYLMIIVINNFSQGDLQIHPEIGSFNYDLNLKLFLINKSISILETYWKSHGELGKLVDILLETWSFIKLSLSIDVSKIMVLERDEEIAQFIPQPSTRGDKSTSWFNPVPVGVDMLDPSNMGAQSHQPTSKYHHGGFSLFEKQPQYDPLELFIKHTGQSPSTPGPIGGTISNVDINNSEVLKQLEVHRFQIRAKFGALGESYDRAIHSISGNLNNGIVLDVMSYSRDIEIALLQLIRAAGV